MIWAFILGWLLCFISLMAGFRLGRYSQQIEPIDREY